MIARRLLLTTFLCGGLAVAGIVAQPSLASSGTTVLQPNSGWAVTQLAAGSAGGDPYCALARRYNSNLVLTVARNAGDETSVAIDFQRPALNNAQSYNVTLRPGFGQERAFSVKPVSGKAMVIRIGQDYAFHDAMARSGKLEVDIAGDSYAFKLPDYADGQKKLGECLAGLIEPAAGAESAAADAMTPPPAPVQRTVIAASAEPAPAPAASAPPPPAVLAAPVSDGRLEAMQEENNRLRSALERERRNYEERYLQESESSSRAAELNEKVRLLEQENSTLRQQVAAVPATVAAAPEPLSCPAPDMSAVEGLQKEVTVLRDENAKLQQNAAGGAALQDKLSSLQQENAKLQQDAVARATAETQLSALRGENERLQQDAAARVTAESQLAAMKAENVRLREGTVAATALEAELASLRAENAGLKARATTSSATDADLAALRDENARLKQEIAAQQARNAELERQIAAGNIADAEVKVSETLKARLATLEEENRALKAANESMAKEGGNVPVSLAQLRSVEEQLRHVQGDRDRLLKQIDNFNKGKEDSLIDISSKNWNLEQATRRFNEAEREVQRLSRELTESRAQCAADKKNLEYMLFDPAVAEQEQISRLINLEKIVGEADAVLQKQKAEYEHKVAVAQQEASAARAMVEAARAATAAMDSGNASQVSQLRQERDTLLQQKAQAESDNASKAARIAVLESQLAGIQTAAGEQDAQQGDVAGRMAALSAENDRLISERNRLERERNDLAIRESELVGKISSLEATIAAIPTGAGTQQEPVRSAVAAAPAARQTVSTAVADYQDFSQSVSRAVEPAVAHKASGQSGVPTMLSGVLSAAGLAKGGDITVRNQSQALSAYSWDSGILYGNAEIQQMTSSSGFEDMVSRYLEKTKARCQGEFAAVPALETQGGSSVAAYEIACVGAPAGADAAASVVFFADQGQFAAVAHEGTLEGMEAAMDARDRLVDALKGAKIASR